MTTNEDHLSQIWHDAKNIHKKPTMDLELIKSKASVQKSKINNLLLMNALIMSITLVVLIWFFTSIAQLQDSLSHWGIGLMTGGLSIRIILEMLSNFYYRKIDLSLDALNSNLTFLRYFKVRKWIQGPFTIFVLICYTIGFHFLIPEFSSYFNETMITLFLITYWLATFIYSFSIYKAVKKEILNYKEIVNVNNQIAIDS